MDSEEITEIPPADSPQEILVHPKTEEPTSEQLTNHQRTDPLHGVKLVDVLEYLVEEYGWQELGERININCFNSDPSIKSSLKFLRKTQWARDKVECLYLHAIHRRTKR